jgi:hypothetical protein
VPKSLITKFPLEFAILHNDQTWVEADPPRGFEPDTMLREVEFRFLGILGEFEFHPASLHLQRRSDKPVVDQGARCFAVLGGQAVLPLPADETPVQRV